MRFMLAIDGALLKFFGKIARAFSRLTGRSNFFLAKCMIITFITALTIRGLNYWFPVLGQKTDATDASAALFIAIIFLPYANLCDSAEEYSPHDRVKIFVPLLYSPTFRIFIFLMTIIVTPTRIFRAIFANEFLFAKLLNGIEGFAFVAFMYFAALDPPSVGKSKIHEWAEGFANLFRKPATVSAEKR